MRGAAAAVVVALAVWLLIGLGPARVAQVLGGLYSRIRHPMYVFLALSLLGIILGLRMPVLLLGWIALVAVQSWQAAREDRVLEQAFGDAYREYRHKTWWSS